MEMLIKDSRRNFERAERLLGDLKLKNHIIDELEKENEELKKEVNKLKDDATFYHTQWGKEIDLCKDLKRELEYAKKRKWWMIRFSAGTSLPATGLQPPPKGPVP
jgi:hypothetical protein